MTDRWSPFSGIDYGPWLTYAIRAKHTGLIKIGKCHADTWRARFEAAEKMIGETCEWIGYLDVPELVAHRAMRDYRVWKEWFEPTNELADYILEHLESA